MKITIHCGKKGSEGMSESQLIMQLADVCEAIHNHYKEIDKLLRKREDLQWELDQMEDEDD